MTSGGTPWLSRGYLADGLFKITLAAVYTLAAAPIGRLLGAEAPLIRTTAVVLLLSGVAEVVFARRRSAPRYVWYLVGYDSGWLLMTGAALLVARQGGSAGGELWFGYQLLASAVLATAFAIGARPQVQRRSTAASR